MIRPLQTSKQEIVNELVSQYLHLNFDYAKPSNIVKSALQATQNKLPSVLDPKTVQIENELEKVYNNLYDFQQLQPRILSRIDAKKLLNGDTNILSKFVFTVTPTDVEDFPKLIVELMDKMIVGP